MTEVFSALMAKLAGAPWLQGIVAALATFVLEDPTTVGAGLLVADHKMAFLTAFVGVSAGIALGDLGLYGGGRLLGPRLVGKGPLTPERLERAQGWFQKNVIHAVVFSRFVPGMRLPTYFGAGMLRAPFWRFAVTAIVASVVWTLILLTATIALGRQILPILGRWRWPVAAVALLLLVVFQRRAGSRRPATRNESPVVSSFEFWPPWLFYIPVALKWLQLAIRHRGLLLPTSANPSIDGGGFIGESKSEILDLVPARQRSWVARWITAVGGQDPGVVQKAIREAGFDFPVVAKPDIGQRGAGVQPIFRWDDLRAYTESFPADVTFVVQEFAGGAAIAGRLARPSDQFSLRDRKDGTQRGYLSNEATSRTRQYVAGDELRKGPCGVPYLRSQQITGEKVGLNDHPSGFGDVQEAGVMWWRKPGEDQGLVTSMTLKVFPALTGDGRRTLGELIEADRRAGHLAGVYKKRHCSELDRVLDSGEVFPLVFAGNHCQGAVFRDGTALVTPELEARIEGIARSIPEFWFGRFDIRFDDLGRFLSGEDFKIIEINGASAEATHIWDASITLREAYRVLFEQFDVLFSIGAANRQRGFNPLSLGRFCRDLWAYRKLEKRYPQTS